MCCFHSAVSTAGGGKSLVLWDKRSESLVWPSGPLDSQCGELAHVSEGGVGQRVDLVVAQVPARGKEENKNGW